jgi:hypothetical protein
MQFTHTVRNGSLTLCLLGLAFTAHAADDSYVSAMNYVSLDVQADNADSRDESFTGSVGMGQYFWLQGSAGKLQDSSNLSLGDMSHFGFGVGLQGQHLMFRINTSRYSSDGAYRQRDVDASIEWRDERFTAGFDAKHRTTDNSQDSVRNFPTLGLTNVALHVDETLTGRGYGAHASFNVTDAFSVYLGGMTYSYDNDYTLTSSTNPVLIRRLLNRYPTIAETLYLNESGLTRSLALLDNSYNFGASYQFNAALLSAQYFIDQALDTGDKTHTVSVGLSFFVGDHWILAPQLGQSHSDAAGDVTFGGLSVSYNW